MRWVADAITPRMQYVTARRVCTEVTVAADDPADEPESNRTESTDRLWNEVRIDPVEIALPGGVGYTLRAYRLAAELAKPDIGHGNRELDDFDVAAAAVARRRRTLLVDGDGEAVEVDVSGTPKDHGARRDRTDVDELDSDKDLDELELEERLEDDGQDGEEDKNEAEPEEVPTFLGRNGRLYLFHSPEKLVEFVKSGAEHDLSELDTWADLADRVTVDDIVARDDDSYELDLVVENLRGGPDAWDPPLILKAGEVARDLGYALQLETVLGSLSSGSPLDDLDEALRATEAGGIGSFFARRRLRKIPTQQTSLAWRTVIGKVSAAADWRD
jgi:hypothetical protein